MRKGLEIAGRIGNRHAQMFATQSLCFCLTAGRYAEAGEFQAEALEQARALKARRYEAFILAQRAEVALSRGCRGEALALARRGREIANETGPRFGVRSSMVSSPWRRMLGKKERLRWPPERRLSRKAPLATTTSGFGATLSSGRCLTRTGTRPRGKPMRFSVALQMRRWLTPLAWRPALRSWRGEVVATRPRPTRTNLGRPSWSRLTNTFTTDGQLRRRERLHWAN